MGGFDCKNSSKKILLSIYGFICMYFAVYLIVEIGLRFIFIVSYVMIYLLSCLVYECYFLFFFIFFFIKQLIFGYFKTNKIKINEKCPLKSVALHIQPIRTNMSVFFFCLNFLVFSFIFIVNLTEFSYKY